MREDFFMRLKEILKTAGIVFLCVLSALFALALHSSPVFERGDGYEISLGASSSAEQIVTDNPLLVKMFSLSAKGESVRYEGDRYEELKSAFDAELLFTETEGGVTNYYLYSSRLGGGIALGGYLVNLHIAVRENRTAVGTPIIFGGF